MTSLQLCVAAIFRDDKLHFGNLYTKSLGEYKVLNHEVGIAAVALMQTCQVAFL